MKLNVKLFRRFRTAQEIFRDQGLSGLFEVVQKKINSRKKRRELAMIQREDSLRERFSEIERLAFWKSATNTESVSGDGSTRERTARYAAELDEFLTRQKQQLGRPVRLFDAPCGDFNWVGDIARREDIEYHGADIVESLVSRSVEKHTEPGLHFSVFDVTADLFPQADVWHCRDCLFHLSYDNIWSALENFVASEIPVALLTSHCLIGDQANRDISDGDFRHLDLTLPPFNMPRPETVLVDHSGDPNESMRVVAVYSREILRSAIAARV